MQEDDVIWKKTNPNSFYNTRFNPSSEVEYDLNGLIRTTCTNINLDKSFWSLWFRLNKVNGTVFHLVKSWQMVSDLVLSMVRDLVLDIVKGTDGTRGHVTVWYVLDMVRGSRREGLSVD